MIGTTCGQPPMAGIGSTVKKTRPSIARKRAGFLSPAFAKPRGGDRRGSASPRGRWACRLCDRPEPVVLLILLVADHRCGVARGDGVCDLHRRLERGLDQRGRFGDQPADRAGILSGLECADPVVLISNCRLAVDALERLAGGLGGAASGKELRTSRPRLPRARSWKARY